MTAYLLCLLFSFQINLLLSPLPPIIILLYLLLTHFFSLFHSHIDEAIEVHAIPHGQNYGYTGIWGTLNKTSSYYHYDWPFLSPSPYGSLTSHVIRDHLIPGSLIPSFCLSIKGRHYAPSLSRCSDGKKSDYGSLCCI